MEESSDDCLKSLRVEEQDTWAQMWGDAAGGDRARHGSDVKFIRLRISDRLSDWCDWSETGKIVASLPFRPVPSGGVELLTRHLQRVQSAQESLIAIKISHHAAAIWLCFSFCGAAETPAVDVLFIYI